MRHPSNGFGFWAWKTEVGINRAASIVNFLIAWSGWIPPGEAHLEEACSAPIFRSLQIALAEDAPAEVVQMY